MDEDFSAAKRRNKIAKRKMENGVDGEDLSVFCALFSPFCS